MSIKFLVVQTVYKYVWYLAHSECIEIRTNSFNCSLDDDEFYRQLAAQAGMEEVSDISEADPAEMAKTIDVSGLISSSVSVFTFT